MRPPVRAGRAILVPLILTLSMIVPGTAQAVPGYLTPQPPFLTLDATAPAGTTLLAIINSGDTLDGFTFSGLPDGIGLMPGSSPGTVDVFVNHEESRVPFLGLADFDDSSVSRLTLDSTGAALAGSVALPSSAGFIRFCSATMVGPAQGFSDYTFLTNEESNDVLNVPAGAPYGADPALGTQRQAGYSVALDPVSGEYTQIAGLGRMNHENSVVVPGGWNKIAVVTGDDTFSAPASQLYLFLAASERSLWRDRGGLWAFRVNRTEQGRIDKDDPFNGANDYGDIQSGDDWEGRFIHVPPEIARGLTADAPQTALENWSNANNVFQFVRVEDIAYDVNDPRVIYFTDTSTTRVVPDPSTGRLMRGPSGTAGLYDNGRVFRMELSKSDPKKVDSFSVLLNGDTGGPGLPGAGAIHNPDNVATSPNSLMVQEDTAAVAPRVWRYDFATQTWSVLATVNDIDWESSGIVDASGSFGPGSWLLDVQAHDVFVGTTDTTTTPGVTYKREGGQLLLLNVPGS
ncbi:MAG: alkaline phosphatase PhoX [Actinomycetota bacterium]